MSKKQNNKRPLPIPTPASAPVIDAWWQQNWVLGLMLVLLAFIAYLPLVHAGFIWDDDAYVTDNLLLSMPDGLSRIWFSSHTQSQYFPLVFTTLRFEYALWGLKPFGYHLVNVCLHVGNAFLLWKILRKLAVPGAWLVAAIFILHPVQVETVAWVTELKNTESTLFYLLTVLAWIRFLKPSDPLRWVWYVLAVLCCALALFAKTTACTLPAALVLVLWVRKEVFTGPRLLQIAPFLLLGLLMGLVSVWWEKHLGNYMIESGASYGIGERLLIATRALWFYAGKIVWPVGLVFSYPKWEINTQEPAQYLGLIGCVAVAAGLCWNRKRLGRGTIAAVVFFVAALSPLLGFIWLYTFRYSFVADHYQYLACGGLIIVLVQAGRRLTAQWDGAVRQALAAAVLALLMFLTWRQSVTYADSEALWRATIAKNPTSWLAHDNLGMALLKKGSMDEALLSFNRALKIKPNDEIAYNNLGTVFLNDGQLDIAINCFQKSIEFQPTDPLAENNLGNALRQSGRLEEAAAHFQKALDIDPNCVVAHNSFGALLGQVGRGDEAKVHFEKALRLRPNYASAYNNLGNLSFQSGVVGAAIMNYEHALKIQPEYPEAQSNLGVALFSSGRVLEAIEQWRFALKTDPQYLNALDNLAWVLATCPIARFRNGDEAVTLAERARENSGRKNPKILRTLAAAYAEKKRFDDAKAMARQALELAQARNNAVLVEALQEQLKSYEAKVPYRDSSTPNLPAN